MSGGEWTFMNYYGELDNNWASVWFESKVSHSVLTNIYCGILTFPIPPLLQTNMAIISSSSFRIINSYPPGKKLS